jgi:hypothetical protein
MLNIPIAPSMELHPELQSIPANFHRCVPTYGAPKSCHRLSVYLPTLSPVGLVRADLTGLFWDDVRRERCNVGIGQILAGGSFLGETGWTFPADILLTAHHLSLIVDVT